ncbi:ATP synthase F0F1 gamma subunit [Zymomonas mobilis subsp. mobilis ZM4 = ATCC 31821]|uniref:ATP synthase gamma chain n=4 Tax=Zymomonas mobilis TaxID=542 RepID=ATPG_ZYMMO|nr:F0F1 ATP synthase subunit gamma [Zymomonas mobilis]Q5NQZ0.1 RecName: Full=ATP synthase gamma chain; AltName: Full=ATP synthase F1 sector gamma subunit; AltName: Full=F-ATPase gamma subunit [Zymomonas mobilis subsp. mobilis ZM4 = ATCC 31821]AAV88864.1 ATP synthase F1, gamma subunit [Zymomonas mobilis subsp. mobilis ZM4 = ATCC 31821]AEH62640.1 ATP synthase F1, gamma subunit [Zymomonas mobilis subsp. mobilis ATCC 10988]AFN56866.1 ATP synthase gamma chain [Zymomonas mobilis subsp. mobilis ATCC 2
MPSLKSLKTRVSSIKSISKITRAMQMVASAKLRRAESRLAAARPYAKRMAQVMSLLAARAAGTPNALPLLNGRGKDQTHLLIVTSSDAGLCGGFNSNIYRQARDRALALEAAGKTVQFYVIGIKNAPVIRNNFPGKTIHETKREETSPVTFENAQKIAQDLIQRFNAGEFDVAHLFFSHYHSVLSQVPTETQIIPAAPEGDDTKNQAAANDASSGAIEFEPDEETILSTLLPRSIAVAIYQAMLENATSEQGSRMSAMENSTRNAGEMISKLSIQYNRLRQAAITTELVEIISGAEAL